MKQIISTSTIAAVLVLGSMSLYAGTKPANTIHTQMTKQAVSKEAALQQQRLKVVSKEIMSGLNNTLFALDAIQKKDTKAAEDALNKATKAFEEALKKDPKLKLVPIDTRIGLYAVDATPEEIQKVIDQAEKLLKEHKVQQAKSILQSLTDEMDIDTVYLPMELYPKATQKALEALKKGDTKTALMTLVEGMHLLVNTRVVMPVGVLTAEEMVTAASKLEKKKKKDALALLDAAQQELQNDHLLGYIGKHSKEYVSLEKQIKALKKEIGGKNNTSGLYKKLKGDFDSLLHKMRLEKHQIKSNESVWQGTAKPHAKAAAEETQDKIRFEEKEETDSF